MIIDESISGSIYCRNRTYALNTSNVISASSKRLACREGAFEIGGVYSATLSLTCRLKGADRFALKGAKIVLYSQYSDEEKPFCIGTFWAVSVQKSGDIFTLNAQDAISWTDVSSYNDVAQNGIRTIGTYLQEYEADHLKTNPEHDRPTIMEWFFKLTELCNRFLEAQTGVANMLLWQAYDDVNNIYFGNEFLWRDDGDGWHPKNLLHPPLYLDNGCANSDCPRDFYSYLAEYTGGFVYTNPETGSMMLGQFGMASLGTAEIFLDELEEDYEIADYTIQLNFVYAYGEISTGNWANGWTYATELNYENQVYIHWNLEANPFIDGFAAYLVSTTLNDKMSSLTKGIWESFYHEATISNGVPGIEELREQSKFTVRPFQCRVHAKKRFSLGQKIRIHAGQEYSSIITSIEWTFRGGHQLSCGGEDSRVMADCLKTSKSDKALKETRNRCASIEEKLLELSKNSGYTVMSQAEYDALEAYDNNTLYVLT